MKKILLSLLVIASVSSIYAQKANVNKAKAKSNVNAENPDFKGARELIKLALEDPTTKDLANTWFVAGSIGYNENDYLYKQTIAQKPYDKDVKGQAIMESYKYYLKAYELDGLPNEKGKIAPKVQKDIAKRIAEYFTNQQNLFAYGAHLFEQKKYDKTVEAWNVYLAIPNLPLIKTAEQDGTLKEGLKKDSDYYKIKYYTAVAFVNLENKDKAIEYLIDLQDKGYEESFVHQLLYQQYLDKQDTVNFVKVLKSGFARYPQESWFLQTLINYYIYSNKISEALPYLEKAVSEYPNVAEYRYVKGNVSEQLGNIEQARKDFESALELKPDYADAYYGIGRLIFNKAVEKNLAANDIKDLKQYNAEKAAAKDVFKQALPYMEKAYGLNNKNYEYQNTLKTLYYNLDMQNKYDEMVKIMKQD